jgi:hypothetical protein
MKLLIERRPRAVAFDGEWQYGRGPQKNPLPGFAVLHQPGELVDFLRARLSLPFRVLYQPAHYPEEHLDEVCRLVAAAGNCTLAIDEVADYCKPAWMPEPLSALARKGRHDGVSLCWTSQRPADVATRLRSVSRNVSVFRLEEVSDLGWLRRRGMLEEQMRAITTLPPRHFFTQDAEGRWFLAST